MSRFSKEGNWQKSLAIFDALPALAVTADTTLTNAAIAACDKGGQWMRAQDIFARMHEKGLAKDTITFSSTISALSKSKQAHLAVEVRRCPACNAYLLLRCLSPAVLLPPRLCSQLRLIARS